VIVIVRFDIVSLVDPSEVWATFETSLDAGSLDTDYEVGQIYTVRDMTCTIISVEPVGAGVMRATSAPQLAGDPDKLGEFCEYVRGLGWKQVAPRVFGTC